MPTPILASGLCYNDLNAIERRFIGMPLPACWATPEDFAALFQYFWNRDFPISERATGARRIDWTIHIGVVVRSIADLMGRGQRAAAKTVLWDWDDFVTFYHYPEEHWIHLRTTNPLESIFRRARLRTDAARRVRRQDNALYLVFKIVERLSRNWRTLNGGANLTMLVLEGRQFKDGILQREEKPELVGARS